MDPRAREGMRNAGRVSAIGMELAASIIGPLVAGWWLDQRLGTAPWLAVGGILLGSVAGFMVIYRTVKQLQADAEKEEGAAPRDEDEDLKEK